MSQRERDLLKILTPVLQGERTQAEAARLADLSVRHIRRLQRKLEAHGDAALVHGLRGRPSNRRLKPELRQQALEAYRVPLATSTVPVLSSEVVAMVLVPVAVVFSSVPAFTNVPPPDWLTLPSSVRS